MKFGQNRCFSHDVLTGRQIFYPFGLMKKDAYCADETDLIKQTGGPDFVTESWVCI